MAAEVAKWEGEKEGRIGGVWALAWSRGVLVLMVAGHLKI